MWEFRSVDNTIAAIVKLRIGLICLIYKAADLGDSKDLDTLHLNSRKLQFLRSYIREDSCNSWSSTNLTNLHEQPFVFFRAIRGRKVKFQ